MAKKKKKSKGSKRFKKTVTRQSTPASEQPEPASVEPESTKQTPDDYIPFQSAFGNIMVPPGLFQGTKSKKPEKILDLSDLEVELTSLSPLLAQVAFIDSERLDPVAASALANLIPIAPSMILRGERGFLLNAAPTIRRIRSIRLTSHKDFVSIDGIIYGYPLVRLRTFQYGKEYDSFRSELEGMRNIWGGRILILLVSQPQGKPPKDRMEAGDFIVTHEVQFDLKKR